MDAATVPADGAAVRVAPAANLSYAGLARRTLTVAAVVAAVVLGLALVGSAANVFLLAFAGVLIAVLLRGLADRVAAWTAIPAGWSLAVVVAALVGLLAVVAWLLAPGLARQADQLTAAVPQAEQELTRSLQNYAWGRQLLEEAHQVRPGAVVAGADGPARAASLLWFSVDLLVDAVVVLFVGLFLAAHPSLYLDGLLKLLPRRKRDRGRQVLHDTGNWLGRWLLGRFISMAVIGVATGVGLWLIGTPLAAILGLVTGVFDFVPTFGPILAAVPTVLVALTVSPTAALYALAVYTAVCCLDGYVVTPLVQMRVSHVPPALLLVAQILMGNLVGGLGLALAAPLLIVVMALTQKLYVEGALAAEERAPDLQPVRLPASE